jgi:hypothetical protein
MTDKDLAIQLLKLSQKATDGNQEETLTEMAVLIKFHRQQYAEKKFAEGLTKFEANTNDLMEKDYKESKANPKKELYSQFLKILIEYRKANPFPKPLINHDI